VNSRLSAVPETERSEVKGVAENKAGIRDAEGVTGEGFMESEAAIRYAEGVTCACLRCVRCKRNSTDVCAQAGAERRAPLPRAWRLSGPLLCR
jgi:hypothetical protein